MVQISATAAYLFWTRLQAMAVNVAVPAYGAKAAETLVLRSCFPKQTTLCFQPTLLGSIVRCEGPGWQAEQPITAAVKFEQNHAIWCVFVLEWDVWINKIFLCYKLKPTRTADNHKTFDWSEWVKWREEFYICMYQQTMYKWFASICAHRFGLFITFYECDLPGYDQASCKYV